MTCHEHIHLNCVLITFSEKQKLFSPYYLVMCFYEYVIAGNLLCKIKPLLPVSPASRGLLQQAVPLGALFVGVMHTATAIPLNKWKTRDLQLVQDC